MGGDDPMQEKQQFQILAVVLVVSYTALAAALYFVHTPHVRLGLGLLAVLPMLLSSVRLSVIEHALKYVQPHRYPRRFWRLRECVDDVLGEIRRLNRIAVDVQQGVRAQEEASEMMDEIEERLIGLIGDIRASAGEESPAPPEAVRAQSGPPMGQPLPGSA